MFETTERAGIEERYHSACNTSNLRVEAETRSSADVLIAAGWSPSRLGGALMRLQSEWSRPVRASRPDSSALKDTELREIGLNLKSRAAVWEGLYPWLAKQCLAVHCGEEALFHFVFPTCQHCEGHGTLKMPNAPVRSGRRCGKCQGTGKRPISDGAKFVLAHFDYCLGVHRGSLKKRLRPQE